jgi:hypothetical protein
MKQAYNCDIQNVIDGFTDNELMFTTYDVTKKLRNDGFTVNHYEVKDYFKSQDYLSSYYESTLHDDLGAMVYQPRVAYGESIDMDKYDPNAIPGPKKCDDCDCCDDPLTPVVADVSEPKKTGFIKYSIDVSSIKRSVLRLFSK